MTRRSSLYLVLTLAPLLLILRLLLQVRRDVRRLDWRTELRQDD